jgi:serine/threonine-protein kinase
MAIDAAEMRDDLRGRLQSSLGTAYTLERELGGGGMARVFVAREEALGRDVVVKVLAPELAQGLSVERFAREIHLAAALQAPHIVPLLAAGVTGEGLPYYTMPYVRGETLRARLARGPVPPGEAMGILRDVAHALAYAHRQGVVHRDIKPENVLLHEGTAVVTDFGIAKAVGASRTRAPERTAATLTRTGTSLGTPAYMAPEQAVGDEVDARADLYAWGVLAFEVLAGAHPFAGRTSAAQLVHAHITEAPPALALRAPAVAPPLAATVMRCLAKDPAARFASADELLRSLDDGAAPSSGPRGRRVASRRALLLAGGLALSAAIGALWWKRAPHPAVDEQRIAVLPFRVATADPSLRYLREGMLDLVAAKLSGDQRAVDQRAVLARWRAAGGSETVDPDPARARAFVEQLGAGRLLQGEVIAVGGSEAVTLSAELLAVPGGRRRASARATGAPQAIAALVDSVVNALLALDAGDDAQRANSLAAIPYPALEVYLRGQRAYRHGDYGAASESFEHALRTDSSFVLAGLMLGRTAGWVLDRRTSRIAERVVRQYRDRLGRNDRVLADASYPDSVHTSCAERLAAYRRATELAPDLPEAWYSLGDQTFHCGGAVYGDVGAMRRARDAFGRALALDPGFSPAREHAGDLLVVSNDTAGARRADEAAARDSTNLFAGARAFFAARSDAERRAVLDRLALEGAAALLIAQPRLSHHPGHRAGDAVGGHGGAPPRAVDRRRAGRGGARGCVLRVRGADDPRPSAGRGACRAPGRGRQRPARRAALGRGRAARGAGVRDDGSGGRRGRSGGQHGAPAVAARSVRRHPLAIGERRHHARGRRGGGAAAPRPRREGGPRRARPRAPRARRAARGRDAGPRRRGAARIARLDARARARRPPSRQGGDAGGRPPLRARGQFGARGAGVSPLATGPVGLRPHGRLLHDERARAGTARGATRAPRGRIAVLSPLPRPPRARRTDGTRGRRRGAGGSRSTRAPDGVRSRRWRSPASRRHERLVLPCYARPSAGVRARGAR